MKVNANVNGKDITITLTKDQLKEISEQTQKKINWKDIKSFMDACEANGDNYSELYNKWKNADLTDSQINGLMLEYCIKTINEGWTPDFNNQNQRKYYNCFEYKKGGWSLSSVNCRGCHSCIGSGLYLETEEKSKHAAKHFLQHYQIYLGK